MYQWKIFFVVMGVLSIYHKMTPNTDLKFLIQVSF